MSFIADRKFELSERLLAGFEEVEKAKLSAAQFIFNARLKFARPKIELIFGQVTRKEDTFIWQTFI